MDRMCVILGISLHNLSVCIREFKAVLAAANADICLHIAHLHLVVFRHSLKKFFAAALHYLTLDFIVSDGYERIAACGVYFFYEQVHELIRHAGRLDEYVLTGLYLARVINEIFRE